MNDLSKAEKLTFVKMRPLHAEKILFWQYPEPYSIYNLEPTNECLQELINGSYFSVINQENELVGFCCTGEEARVPGGYDTGVYEKQCFLDIGIGLKPELTGMGIGEQFFKKVLQFLGDTYSTERFRLVVAAFNKRAIRLYLKTGFIEQQYFSSKVKGSNMTFLSMIKEPK
ncbi:GNAT family N-acetyltransferase [Alteribacter populi]|uniref:GNAT family N-acetyltransferase n=1 Tax=Alteribacter populi TaxID=2011011 RepID=UPI000BBB3524|nr:GNAT family N-acetyltransferase [Alteribacter populi]